MDALKELYQVLASLSAARSRCDAMLNSQTIKTDQLDFILGELERAVIRLRIVAEWNRPRNLESSRKLIAPIISEVVGKIEVNEFGWVHILLNTLLPSCRYKTPFWLENTLSALLLGYEERGRKLPRFEQAMLIIEEHCDIHNRQVFDQDNKGWKAIPNAIEGLLVDDDDQFTLELALLSHRSEVPCCHIWILPAAGAGEYFSIREGGCGCGFPGSKLW